MTLTISVLGFRPGCPWLAAIPLCDTSSVTLQSHPAAGLGVQVRILGPLTVVRGGREIALPPAEQAVLAMLAMAEGRPVRPDVLADALWNGSRPASHAGMLHTYVSRIRGILGPNSAGESRDRVRKNANGYSLVVSDDELDLLLFRRRQDAARQAVDRARGLELRIQALGLWHGLPLAGLDALAQHPAVVALADDRLQALLELADVASTAGRYDVVLPMLQEEAAAQPLNEAVHARELTARSLLDCWLQLHL